VRIVAATNRDLDRDVAENRFRADLYYRLNVFPIAIPPLRKRKADLPLLVNYFIAKISREYGQPFEFSKDCLAILTDYDWPGNVRELENLIERVAIMADSQMITPQLLPDYLFERPRPREAAGPEREEGLSQLETMEKETLLTSLARNEWIQQKAAREIGLTLRQMGYRVKKYQLNDIIRRNKKKYAR
jgi:Nif-specific regulatory protein